MKNTNYRIGLDIGIGSIGWAVITGEKETAHIEDFGVRIFESGENVKGKCSLCQDRRAFRGGRRLVRRRYQRKLMLKNHLENIGLLRPTFHDELAECYDDDVYALKVLGLTDKLSVAQLYKCLAHTCNHRGYRDFYEDDDSTDEQSEDGVNKKAAQEFDLAFTASGKRTVSEFLLSDFKEGKFVKYRNNAADNEHRHTLIRRTLLRDEAELILRAQSSFYPQLNDENISRTLSIIFAQRDFEDGPGDKDDPHRRYKGFVESLGACPYNRSEKRGHRSTLIADVFAVTNTLSQYRYVNKATGEYHLAPEVTRELVDTLITNASLTLTEAKAILKKHGYEMHKSDRSDDKGLTKAVKYLKILKKCVEDAGESWESLISEEQFDISRPSLIHRIGETISLYQTPARRKAELKKTGASPALIKAVCGKKISGTANVGYSYMCAAIDAFLHGDIYGNFQAAYIKNSLQEAPVERSLKLLPSHISDPDIRKNPVVFKAINETRKVINAIIAVYGSPDTVIVEVANELGKSFSERQEDEKRMRDNEKNNTRIREKIAELLGISAEDVTGVMLDKYKLYEQQEGKSLYSCESLGDLQAVLEDPSHVYEIDHIVPYSLILDNTLHNKALVFTRENQAKGQRTPLMYLKGEAAEKYLAFANHLYTKKSNPIREKKLQYMKLSTLYGEEAENLLTGWKSRNINDTRYITKYVIGLIKTYLLFSSDKPKVYGVKGTVTSRFRRTWLRHSKWGEEDKDRSTYLNHAVDAVVIANLSPAYIEIGSDAIRLYNIYKKHKKQFSAEYDEYLEKCVSKMKKYYFFDEEYTRSLLQSPGLIPAYVRNLEQEVEVRFYEGDEETFRAGIERCYGAEHRFILPPHMPITSHKQERSFSGCIADANPVRVVTIDGETYKVGRKAITAVKASDIPKLYTGDKSLLSTLERIFAGKSDSYTVEKYMEEQGLTRFTTDSGQPVHKVSVLEGKYSNYYRKQIDADNYTNLGMLKYYCIEVYKNTDGKTCACGVRYVDIIKKNKKLMRKPHSLPADYAEHIMYLFKNDYIEIYDKKNRLKFRGYYKAVYNINQNAFCYALDNAPAVAGKCFTVAPYDTFKKYDVSILGRMGGEIKCSAPLSSVTENI